MMLSSRVDMALSRNLRMRVCTQRVRVSMVLGPSSSELPCAARAVVSALRAAACGSLEFSHRIEQGVASRPSEELLCLCSDQLRACERDFQQQLRLTVYLRTPECYGTSNLELRHVSWRSPLSHELVLLFRPGDTEFSLQQAENSLAEHGIIELPEFKSLVVPMARDLCLLGLLVAEMTVDKDEAFTFQDTADLRKVAQNLALACVLDQRVALLQHTYWQNTMKIDRLLEQARSSISTLKTLGKMLLPQFEKGEIARDVVEDMLLQGDRTKQVVQDIQEVLYFAMGNKATVAAGPDRLLEGSPVSAPVAPIVRVEPSGDVEVPMPPFALAPMEHLDASSCDVEGVLSQLVKAGSAMAAQMSLKLQLAVDARALPLTASVDETTLRQAMSKLIDCAIQRTPRGGWIKVAASRAPGGGVLVLVEDNGPDMSFVVNQAQQAFEPLGTGLTLDSTFASLKLARDILEGSGVVLRVTSPFIVGSKKRGRGVRVEVWIPGGEP